MANSYRTVACRLPRALIATTVVVITAAWAGCASSSSNAGQPATTPAASASSSTSNSPAPAPSQKPVLAEHNPPGDIPETTVYVAYQSPTVHAVIKVPEGWARQLTASGAMFSSALNSITITTMPTKAAPTVATARSVTVPSLSRTTLAFRLQSVRAVSLAGGAAAAAHTENNSQT